MSKKPSLKPTDKPPPIMRNPSETDEIKRLREIVTRGLGDAPWEVTGLKAGSKGEILVTLKPKAKT